MTLLSPPRADTPQLDLASDMALRLDRVAGLSADRLPQPLIDVDLMALRADALSREIVTVGAQLSETLFALVPRLDDARDLRRAVLALRRTTRLAEPAAPDAEAVSRIRTALVDRGLETDSLVRWVRCAHEHADLISAMRQKTAAGVAAASRALEDLRADDALLTAIADASSEFAAAPGDAPLLPARHAARSMLAYATRAALKTSPFASLTTVGVVGSTPVAATSTIAHSYAAAWLDAIARDETAMHALEFEALDTGGIDPTRDRVGVPELMETTDFVWRRTVITHLREAGGVLARLQALGRVPGDRLLTEIGGSDPFASYRRMLDAGLLRPLTPWGHTDQSTLAMLAAHLQARVPQHPMVATLTSLVEEARAVVAASGRERGRRRMALRDRAQEALRRQGISAARSRFEIYIDVAPPVPSEPFPAEVSSELDRLSRALDRHVRRSTAHDAIVAHFVDQYGTGGTAPSAWGWLLGAGSDDTLLAALRSPSSAPDSRPIGRSQPDPAAAIAVQRVGGESLLVVNQTLDGQGGVATRFARLHDGPLGITARVAARAARLAGGGRPIEFVPAADVNSMQFAASGALPRLRLPTDSPTVGADAEVALTSLSIRHDPLSNSLEILDAGQRPIVLFYLGLVPPHMLSGVDRVLAVLANPWRIPPLGAPAFAALASPTDVVAHPRRRDGQVVLRRATWSVPRAELFDVVDDDTQLLRAVGRWRRRHAMPAETFVRLIRATPSFDAVARKPIPLDLRSPHSLRRLTAELDRDVVGLEIAEALPSTTQFLPSSPFGEPRAVEHLVFLSWQRERAHFADGRP